MNDFSEIENELKKLRPAPVSKGLIERVEKRLLEGSSIEAAAARPPKSRSHANWISLGLGIGLAAAAGFLMLARVQNDQPIRKEPQVVTRRSTPNEAHTLPAGARFVPAGLTEVVYHTEDEGLHFPEGATQPVRRVRRHTRETYQWQNPKTGASLRVSYPSEEVMLLPISGQ